MKPIRFGEIFVEILYSIFFIHLAQQTDFQTWKKSNYVHTFPFFPTCLMIFSDGEQLTRLIIILKDLYATVWISASLQYRTVVQVKENLWSPDKPLLYCGGNIPFLPVCHSTWATTLWFLIIMWYCKYCSCILWFFLPLITLLFLLW